MPDAFDELNPSSTTPGSTDPYSATIQTIEGWYPGSKSYRNNNPGNLKYVKQPEATGADPQGFAVFPDYAHGLTALHKQIALDAGRGLTIQQFANKYAPVGDNNDPTTYAARLASATGKSPDDLLGPDAFDTLNPNQKNNSVPKGPAQPSDTPIQALTKMGQTAHDYLHEVGKNIIPDAKGMIDSAASAVKQAVGNIPNFIKAPLLPNTPDPLNEDIDAIRTAGKGVWNMISNPAETFKQHPVQSALSVAGLLGMGWPEGEEAATLPRPILGEAQYPARYAPAYDPQTAAVQAAHAESNGLPPPEFNPVAEAQHVAVTKPALEALQPPNPLAFRESLKRSIPQMQEEDPKFGNVLRNTPEKASGEIQSKLNKLHDTMEQFMAPKELGGTTIDGNIIANEKMAAIPPKLEGTDPSAYAAMKAEADTYRRPMKPSEVQSYLETTNDQAHGLYDKLPGERNISVGASAGRGQVITEANAFRQQLYQALDPEHDGAAVAELQKRRGSLIDLKNQVDDMNKQIANAPTPSVGQRIATTGFNTAQKGLEFVGGRPASAVDLAVGSLKKPKAVQNKLADVFDKWDGPRLPDVGAPPAGGIVSGPDRLDPYVQEQLFGKNGPSIPGNTKVPPPRYPGQPPSSSIDLQTQIPGVGNAVARNLQYSGPGGSRVTIQNTLPPYAPKLLNAPEDPLARYTKSTPAPPPTYRQEGGPYKVVSPGGAELGSYHNLADAQKDLSNNHPYKTSDKPTIVYRRIPTSRQLQ